jgi:hypothetical protein
MNPDLRQWSWWPLVLAAIFFSIPPLLFYFYPYSFWAGTDYEPLGLADALNMAYRIADRQMYSARGMMDHPGVPFYFMNWLALALTGYPVASTGPGFLDRVIAHVDVYLQFTIWLGALAGAAGVYIFARTAQKLVPISVIVAGFLIWLISTPATLLEFESPSIDLFAIIINGLFFATLVQAAYDRDLTSKVAILAGCVSAFAYLNKLSYIYVPLALGVTGFLNLSFRHANLIQKRRLWTLSVASYVLVVVATGIFIIGWDGFLVLIRFHSRVFLGSGLYGGGDRVVVSGSEVWRAVMAIPADRAYAVFIALAGGAALAVGGFMTGRKGPEHVPVALISIGTGLASLFSAIFVMKHYDLHYTAGISATLPSSVVAGYLLLKSWGWDYRHRIAAQGVAAVAILVMAALTAKTLIPAMVHRTNTTELAKADLQDIQAQLAESKRGIEFAYRTPFAAYGEGFVVNYASVPRLTSDYAQSHQRMFSSILGGLFGQDAEAYVIDKAYFPTVESIKAATNVALLGPKPVVFKDGDKLIELRTVFILIPG